MKFRCGILWLGLLWIHPAQGQNNDDAPIRRAVVKVWANQSQLNLSNLWQRGDGREVSGSGVWLGERRVLTNAHVVERATQVSVQTSESSDRIPVTVKVTSPEMDLAILELENDDPFSGVPAPVIQTEIPKLRSAVRVYGFPEGGNSLSVTEGIISRVEFAPVISGKEGLRIQIDAAVNHGNSGGPAILDGRIVGIAFQRRQAADNIGYLISSDEVKLFLEDIADEKYDGKLELFIGVQRLQNRALREKLGVPKDVTGLWMRDVRYRQGDFPLRRGDVITHIGDHEIDNSGVTKLTDEIKVIYTYFVSQLARDNQVTLRILRDGQPQSIEVPLIRDPVMLLKELKGGYPDWFVYGPFVFSEATADLLRGLEAGQIAGDDRQRVLSFGALQVMARRRSPLLSRRQEQPAFPGEQLVLVANWLPHRISTGYSNPQFHVLKRINGQEVKNMSHLVEILRDCSDEFVTFEYADHESETQSFRRSELNAATNEVMNNIGIPRRGSVQFVELWEKKKTE